MTDICLVKMICDKTSVIIKYCTDGNENSALAGMGDITEPLTEALSKLMQLKASAPGFRFDEMSLLGGLQLALGAMQAKDLGGLASALRECIRPELEQALSQLNGEFITDSEAEGWAESLELRGGDQVVCMFGYGDGACYTRLCARQNATFIVFEPETDSIADLKEQLCEHVDFYRLNDLLVCAHPGYERVFATEYAAFVHAVNENRERVLVNKNTLGRFRDSASRNVITNLHILEKCNLVSDLAAILPRDVPVIIVSAGPSLDKNIELLKEAKGHCLIFAVDTAMKYLMQHDIMPDVGITVEPIKPMANYADDRIFDVPHIFDCESNPEIVTRERGRIFIYNCRDYVRRLIEAAGKAVPDDVASGGSVATAAFAVCYELQMRTIILIGQDLAYSGTATHAGGVESAGINGDIGTDTVDGIDGEPVRTRSDWKGYLKWFESAIKTINDQKLDMHVIDATEGGALIHGSRVMTLKAALDTYCLGEKRCDYVFSEALEHLAPIFDAAEYAKVRELNDASFKELEEVKAAAREASGLCTGMIERRGSEDALNRIAGLRKTCETALMYPLINNYAVPTVIDEIDRLRQARDDEFSEIKQQRLAFDAIADACDYFAAMK